VQKYGGVWAVNAYQYILEDEDRHWQLLMSVVPLARTPQSKRGGADLQKYSKKLRSDISDYLTPWVRKQKEERIRKRLKEEPRSRVLDENGKEIDVTAVDMTSL